MLVFHEQTTTRIEHVMVIWNPIPSEEGYEASNTGHIRSLDRVDTLGRRIKGRMLRPSLSGPPGKQYLKVTPNGNQRKVHHLVLEAFVGPRPEGMEGCHNNRDKLDNRLANIRWDTPSENNLDKRPHGSDPQVRKTHCPRGHEYTPENVYDPTMRHRRCKTCIRDKAREQYRDNRQPVNPRTHCRQGHELTPDNAMGPSRKCRICNNTRRKAAYAAKKGT